MSPLSLPTSGSQECLIVSGISTIEKLGQTQQLLPRAVIEAKQKSIRMPRDPKAVGSNPDGYWAFFSSFSLINVINSLSEVQLYSLSLLRNVQIEAKQVKCT